MQYLPERRRGACDVVKFLLSVTASGVSIYATYRHIQQDRRAFDPLRIG